MGDVLATAFRVYANRPCFGYRPTGPGNIFHIIYYYLLFFSCRYPLCWLSKHELTLTDGSLLPAFHWVTFKEVWARATAFGAAVRSVLGCEKGSFVGICARNRLDWYALYVYVCAYA